MQFMGELHCLRVQITGAFSKKTIFQPPLLFPHLTLYALQLNVLLTDVFMHQVHQL